MKILINGIDERHEYSIKHISNLFFEEATIIFNCSTEEWDLNIRVNGTVFEDGKIAIDGRLVTNDGKKDLTASFSYELKTTKEETLLKGFKRGVNHVYLQLLQQYTGVIQPWGTLTGIRPTKLLHQMLRNEVSKDEARNELKELYLVSEEKVSLLEEIVERQLKVVPDLYELDQQVSIYIGIPFCPTKCAYCTFPAYAINRKNNSVSDFLQGLHYEIEETGKWLKEHNIGVTTIYYGGGTPTSITADEMDCLYEKMYRSFPQMDKLRELTVEAGRPDTITPEKVEVMKKWNVERISINPQSFENETLKLIGRHHTVEETKEKYRLAKKLGMDNINMDLIIGLPGEGLPEMNNTLNETEKLMPESLTVHTLSFKRASTMTKKKENYHVASRDEINDMMRLTTEWTNSKGYVPYYLYRQKNILGNLENIGYALPGKESIYNIMIMEECQTIIGLGCGAASKFVERGTGKITRFANAKDPHTYNERYEYYTHEKLKRLTELFLK